MLGIVVRVELITAVAALILIAPVAIAQVVTALRVTPDSSALIVIGDMLASVLVAPLGSLATVLLYFDLRVRTDGFDLELLARDSGRGGGAASDDTTAISGTAPTPRWPALLPTDQRTEGDPGLV